MPAAVRSAPCSSSFGSFLSHSEREARSSGFSVSVRAIGQYQPDSGSSNSGSPSEWNWRSGGAAGVATCALRGGGGRLVRRAKGGRGGLLDDDDNPETGV